MIEPFVTLYLYQYTHFSTSVKFAKENCMCLLLYKLSFPYNKSRKKDIFTLLSIHMFPSLDQHFAHLLGVSVGLRCGVSVAQWGSHWAPTGPSCPVVGGRWGPGYLPSSQGCPGWWDSPLLAPSSSRPQEELQPERRSLKRFKGIKWWQEYKLLLCVGK